MTFEDLVAFRLAIALADDLHSLVRPWSHFDRSSIGLQLVRSADSVGANIAEAYGRWHPRDQRRCLHIARGSLYEMQYWLMRAARQKLIDESVTEQANELGRVLNGLIKAHAGAND